jgi:hypothetical protein
MSVVFDGDSYFHVSVKKTKMLGLLAPQEREAQNANAKAKQTTNAKAKTNNKML